MSARQFYQFGPFRIDTLKRVLARDGEPVPLNPKAFDILVTLVEGSDRIVEKEDLIRKVWPHAFVEEGNLTQNIHLLRKALGDDPNHHRYIATIPGRGYRFVAQVSEHSGEQSARAWEPTSRRQDFRTTIETSVEHHSRSSILVEEEYEDKQQEEFRDNERENWLRAAKEARFPWASGRVTAAQRLRQKRIILAFSLLVVAVGGAIFYFFGISSRPAKVQPGDRVHSLAVIPFKIVGPANGQDYLGLGMADALITRLGGIRQVIVRPTGSVFQYSDSKQDPLAAGAKLRVDSVLDGTIQRSSQGLRITVRLVRVKDGATLWAGKFDETFTDLFTVQDSISERVIAALSLTLAGEEEKRLAKRQTQSAEAFQAYLEGRYFWNRRTQEGFNKAVHCFQQAIEKDPNYALAYAGLADCYFFLNVTPQAKAAVRKALEIDDTLAEPHASLALASLLKEWNWPEAEREFRRAIDANPNYATAHHWYAYYLAAMGNLDAAITEMRRARELDPLSLIINTDLGQLFYYARQYDQAIEQLRKTLDLDPNFVMAHCRLGEVYEQKGLYDEAIKEFQKVGHSELLGYAYALQGQRTQAMQKLKEFSDPEGRWLSFVAVSYAALGEKNRAFELLKKACAQRDTELVLAKVDPKLDSLRSDPRFTELLRCVGLPQ